MASGTTVEACVPHQWIQTSFKCTRCPQGAAAKGSQLQASGHRHIKGLKASLSDMFLLRFFYAKLEAIWIQGIWLYLFVIHLPGGEFQVAARTLQCDAHSRPRSPTDSTLFAYDSHLLICSYCLRCNIKTQTLWIQLAVDFQTFHTFAWTFYIYLCWVREPRMPSKPKLSSKRVEALH